MKNKYKLTLISIIFLIFKGFSADANPKRTTFIGNGGDPLDFALSLTLENIRKTYEHINTYETENLCECEKAWEPKLCDLLDSLSKKQKKFCENFILKKSKELLALTKPDFIDVKFFNGTMQIKENNEMRVVGAVANKKNRKITINRQTYETLSNLSREALIAHEHGHFLTWNNTAIDDTSEVGPFKTGREFLNAMGAAIAVVGYEEAKEGKYDIESYSAGWSQWYLSYLFSERKGIETPVRNIGNDLIGDEISISYFNGWYGATFKHQNLSLDDDFYNVESDPGYSGVYLEETIKGYSLGPSFRYFPFASGKSMWSQIQLQLSIMGSYEIYKTEISDNFTKFGEDYESYGASIGLEGLFPVSNGFWFNLGYKTTAIQRDWQKFKIKQEKLQTDLNIGVSYGW